MVREFERLTLACLNPDDLIISKMFRGTLIDVQDCLVLIVSESIDMKHLASRYRETADYYYNPATCKKNLQYLLSDLEEANVDASPLKEMFDSWRI